MVFSSLIFLYAFLPLSLICYALCGSLKAKNICLLLFSLIFYTWGEPKYVLLLMAMSFFDWFFALRLQHTPKDDEKKRKLLLALACVVNLGLIGYFKYAGMIFGTFGYVPDFVSRITLPLGISFYTFQLLSYVIDVYRGDSEAQEEYWHVLLFAALFHQCIAGPIVRYKLIAQELFDGRDELADMPDGAVRFARGLAKKVILANTCGKLVEQFLLSDAAIEDASLLAENIAQLSSTSALGLWLGVICYALQIYFDFSAYSDMAIGMGKMVGLHYLENFNFPYISRSVTEFWRRWHISLGTFFRDYVYIPLGGNRRGPARQIFNLLVVWALTGLWHGASLNFILWGLYFFVFLMIEKTFLKKLLDRLPMISNIYLILVVLLGWVLFRYTELSYIPVILKGLVCANGNPFADFEATITLESYCFFFAAALLLSTPIVPALCGKIKDACRSSRLLTGLFAFVDYAVVPLLFLVISTAQLVSENFNPFLYFRF